MFYTVTLTTKARIISCLRANKLTAQEGKGSYLLGEQTQTEKYNRGSFKQLISIQFLAPSCWLSGCMFSL